MLTSFMMKAGLQPSPGETGKYVYSHQAIETIFIFASNGLLLNAEGVLAGSGLPFRMIATPQEVHSACEQSIAFDESDRLDEYLTILKQADIQPGIVYQRRGREFTAV